MPLWKAVGTGWKSWLNWVHELASLGYAWIMICCKKSWLISQILSVIVHWFHWPLQWQNDRPADDPDVQARYQNRLASAKIRDYLKEQLPQQDDAGKMLTMTMHPEDEREIYRIGWNVVKPMHPNAIPIGDEFGSSCAHRFLPARNYPWLLYSDVGSGTSMPSKCTKSRRFPSKTLSSCQLAFAVEVLRLLFQQQICCSWMIVI